MRFCRGLQSESISEHCIDGGIHPWLQQRGATPGLGANLCNPGEISGDRGSSGSRPRVSTARNANGPGVMSRASNLERSLLNVTDCGRCRDHTAATAVRQRPRWDGVEMATGSGVRPIYSGVPTCVGPTRRDWSITTVGSGFCPGRRVLISVMCPREV